MTTETAPQIDEARAMAFAGQMVGVMNSSLLGFMTSIGHQTGLFDKMAGLPPSTSQQIADATGLNERYVREWLGAMVTGGIVEYNAGGQDVHAPARARGVAHARGGAGEPGRRWRSSCRSLGTSSRSWSTRSETAAACRTQTSLDSRS